MRSEGYSTWSARKLGSNLLCYGGKREEEKGERKEGVNGQSVEGNLNAMKKEKNKELLLSSFIDFFDT